MRNDKPLSVALAVISTLLVLITFGAIIGIRLCREGWV